MADVTTTEIPAVIPPVIPAPPTVPLVVAPVVPAIDPSEDALPAEVKAILKKERDLTRAAQKQSSADALKIKAFEDAGKTESEKLLAERDALKAENAKLQIETLRRDVAAAKGLDPKAIARLQGSTREEMEADADELLTLLKPGRAPFGEINQGTRNAGGGRVYSTSELNDHTFFMAHQADILLAQKEGRITD